jgi:hypothetical protein
LIFDRLGNHFTAIGQLTARINALEAQQGAAAKK